MGLITLPIVEKDKSRTINRGISPIKDGFYGILCITW
jgi:hypothetical protein